MKTTQPTPESTNDAMIAAPFHGYSVPACSKANTSRIEAPRDVNAPRKSTLRQALSETSVLKKRAGPG
jgi:hypothetical protein